MVENNLKELRIKRGYSQNELSALTNCSEIAIRSYENGKLDLQLARFNLIVKLCIALNCKQEDLFGKVFFNRLIRKGDNMACKTKGKGKKK